MARTRTDFGWTPFRVPGLLACCLFAGCAPWNGPMPVPPELTEAGVRSRLVIPTPQVRQVQPIASVSACGAATATSAAIARAASQWPVRLMLRR